ncbi:DUF1993 domain-containing protein [Brevundimonas sp.]|uniref:DUF1993 domain-containing protein n=1 Tax=Brevundimonas sp. TaxID=1871086 RepID=UPI00260AAE0D|nr:DUF1993 domain-containing protein [Brevundimonas sp.]
MTFSLHDASASAFARGLNVLLGLLDKARASGLSEAELWEARLTPDMRPFPDQIRMAAFSARSCVGRLTGEQWPKTADDEATLEALEETVRLSLAFVEAADPAAFEGAETRRVELRFPGVELDFEGAGYLTSFALPNFQFHLAMAYAILRHRGVELGKRDYLGKLALV